MKTIRIRPGGSERFKDSTESSASDINLLVSCDGTKALTKVENPFNDADEVDLGWYLEEYAAFEPFEIGKAKKTVEKLKTYGQKLSETLVSTGVVPQTGDLAIEIEIDSSTHDVNSSLNRLHWEILADTSKWPKDYRFGSVAIARVKSSSKTTSEIPPDMNMQRFNMLMVVCRPGGRGDIDHQLVSRPVVDIIQRLSHDSVGEINITILRPPTWASFKKHLSEVEPGHYQLVHFDMHGGVIKDENGELKATLSFCKADTQNPLKQAPDYKTADQLASVLKKAQVTSVVFNSCESAKEAHGSPNANLAQSLVHNGLGFVMAMSYKILESAVEIFMGRFYCSILEDGLDVAQAAEKARTALLCQPERRALFSHKVKIEDFINPIVYRNSQSPLFSLGWKKTLTLECLQALSIEEPEDSAKPPMLVGRDAQISELELLIEVLAQKLIRFSGQAGCGKTALLRYCEWWWTHTKFVDATLYIDLRNTDQDEFTVDYLIQQIRHMLKVEANTLPDNIEYLVRLLNRRKCLIVLDGFDPDACSLNEAEYQRLQKLIERASHGRTTFILSMRNTSIEDLSGFTAVQNASRYRLSTLSVRSSVKFAETVTMSGDETVDTIIRGKESMYYLEKVMILLDNNPLAIEVVCSQPGALENPKALFWMLISGHIPVNAKLMENSHLIQSMHLVLYLLDLETDISLNSRTIFKFATLAPFWGLIPNDLTYYYYFIALPFLKDSVDKMDGPLGIYMFDEMQKHVQGSMANFGYNECLPRLVNALKQVGALEDAVLYKSDGSAIQGYHINPVATIYLHSRLTPDQAAVIAPAYVKFSTLWLRWRWKETDKEEARIEDISWDGALQHRDHTISPLISALSYSLNSNLADEIEQYGMSHTDLLLQRTLFQNWLDLRNAEIGNFLANIHVIRLMKYAGDLPRGPNKYVLINLGAIAAAFFRGREPNAETVVRSFLELVDQYLKNEGILSPLIESRWFELRRAEAVFQYEKGGPWVAKPVHERNLRMDPQTTLAPELFDGIRRVQYQSLMEWISCVVEVSEGYDEDEVFSQLKPILEQCRPGQYFEHLMSNTSHINITTIRLAEIWSRLLKQEKNIVGKFGALTHRILNENMLENFNGISQDKSTAGLIEFMKKQGITEEYNEVELVLRGMSKDSEGTKALLRRQLALETSDRSTDWRKLGETHMMLYQIAKEKGDWETAKHHLDERWKLHEGNYTPEFLCEYHMACARSLEGLKHPFETAEHFLRALNQVNIMEDEKFYYRCAGLATTLTNLDESLQALGENETNFGPIVADDVSALRKFLSDAKETRRLYEEFDKDREKHELLYKLATELQAAVEDKESDSGERVGPESPSN